MELLFRLPYLHSMRLLIFLLISTSALAQDGNLALPNVYKTTIPGMEIHCSDPYYHWNDPLSGSFQLVNTKTQKRSVIFSLPDNYKPFSINEMYRGDVIFGLDSTKSIYAKVRGKIGAINVYGEEVRLFQFHDACKAGKLNLLKKGKKWYLDTLATTKLIPIGKGEIVGYGGLWDDFVLLKNRKKFTFVEANGNVGSTRTFYDTFSEVERDVFMIHRNDSSGLVNSNGEIVFPLSPIRLAAGNGYWIATKDNQKAMINSEGKLVTEYKYKQINASNYDDFTIYYMDNKEGLMDLNGNELTPPIYDYLRPLIDGHINAYITLNGSRMYGCLNSKGEITIPLEYSDELFFHEGLAFAGKNGKYGFINEQNEVVISFRFDYTPDVHFEEGWAHVKLNGKYVAVDQEGNTLEAKSVEK